MRFRTRYLPFFLFAMVMHRIPSYAFAGDTLYASSLNPIGRYDLITDEGLELISSAVHFGFQFTGRQFAIDAHIKDPVGHNYIQYTVDGIYQRRLRISGRQAQVLLIDGLPEGNHTVWIYKATEAATGPVFIKKIVASHIASVKIPDLPLIEFIGNSITCGAASDASEIPCGAGEYYDQHNAYMAYGPRLSRALHVNYILSSVSGIGIYRNWNSLSPVMPDVYEKTDFDENSSRYWNFKTYSPRIVCIALGTNDFSDGDGVKPRLAFDSAQFVNRYIAFGKLVQSKYPEAQIVLLSSPMLNGGKREKLQNCLEAVKNAINLSLPSKKPVLTFFYKPMEPRGCGYHPNVEDHAILAKEMEPFFKALL